MTTQNYEELISLYHNINVYCAIAALIFLVTAVFLFVWLKIPQVFGELTGKTAQKAIDQMISEGASSGSLTSAKIGYDGRRQRRGKTGTLGTGRLRKNTGNLNPKMNETLDTYGSAETDVLDTYGSAETDVLNTPISQPACETNIQNTADLFYQEPESETMVLSQNQGQEQSHFVILRSVVEIHTDEVI